MLIFLFKNALRLHFIFSFINFILYELIRVLFGYKILENGWAETDEYVGYYKEHPEEAPDEPFDFWYFAVMFIPFFNICCTADLIEMILYTPEQVALMEEEERNGT